MFEQAVKFMKRAGLAAVTLIMAAFLVGVADAQRKTPRRSTTKKTTTTNPTTTIVPPLAVRAGREKVSIQRSNVDNFINVLGPIAQAIETLDESSKTKKLPQATLDKNEANKQKVIQAIRNLKDGLSVLETEFRTKPELQKYLQNIQGITELASQAEDTAIAGKFVASKEPLRNASQKLTDTLAVMPQ